MTFPAEPFCRVLTGSEQRHINRLSANPVNTLSVRRFEAQHNEPDVPSAKRQKKDNTRASDSTTSPYFTTPRAKKSNEFHNVHVESDEIFDLISTSSAGNVGVNGLALAEYRNVQPPSRKANRRRRSRTSSNFQQRDAVDASSSVYRTPALSRRPLISTVSDSPDVLDFEELSSGVPEVVSSISSLFGGKRDRPYRLADNSGGRQYKRHKLSTAKEPIDISEDELQGDSAKCTGPNKKESAASQSSRNLGGLSKSSMRGDLHHTAFGKPADLEKKAERAFDEAKNWIASNVTSKNSSRTYTRDKKENDIGRASSPPGRRPGSTRAKLKDTLIQSAKDFGDSAALQRVEELLDFDIRRSTRSSGPSTRHRMPSPIGWTQLNPEWHESWQAPLVFPPTGKNRATVDKIDIPRLDENEFLNDNLINFYIRYLEHTLEKERPELLRKVYFFSTFFFEKLRSTKGKINYDGVKAWTAKVDLLSYDYIFVPVNEHAHWYLAIICNIPNAIQPILEEKGSETSTNLISNAIEVTDTPSSPRLSTVERDLTEISLEDGTAVTGTQKEGMNDVPPSPLKRRKSAGPVSKLSPTQPRIVTLDSLGGPHPPTCKALKEYLVEEAKTKKGIDLTTVPTGMTARGIPEQNNFCDCGVFILGYMQEFLANPDEAARKLLMKEELGWDIRPSELRNRIRGLLFDLQGEQQKHHKQLEEEKRLRKAKKKSSAETTKPYSSPVRLVELSPPVPKLPGSFPSDSPESKPVPEATLSSSESVQEADSSESSGLSGKASHEAQQKPKPIEEFRFISPLPGSIVVELKSAKGYDKSEFEETTLPDDDDEVQIVKELSGSPYPYAFKPNSKTTETRRRRHSSVEVIESITNRPIPSSRVQNQGDKPSINPSPGSKPRQSIEYDSDNATRGEAKYDGIDRSGKPADKTAL
ncbi:uncharacterized protein TRIVIDRAFT_33671 [Trichoderma virens Gv29-8]|uniref:Ubiquitin-like protease family profile domain-containing protein n=1 Tax=Hypocrea virens (strain Gv29-8 / FGSC 10586) TaxID=413071 RepID=G9MDR2_HYPVG|nr:uncharacterized protein TRIVIDRAFT_33671 [Trichoderma virens Gv29-8]EHK27221.1 hypothetical protein TRIVIDRAFT_33671 [Trichoderma virens Gv29-8]